MPSFIATSLLLATAALQTVSAQNCTISFEGRIPQNFSLTDFESNVTSVYNPTNVLGRNTTWSQVLSFPKSRTGTLFSRPSVHKPVEVKITDASVFQPNPSDVTSAQLGFRRSELIPVKFPVSSEDSTTGVKTLHFSLKANPARPLNFSHEYQLVFLEDSSYSTNQFVLKTGTLLDGLNNTSARNPQLILQSNQKTPETLFTAPFDQRAVHNFAVTQDFDQNTIRIYYSTGNAPLTPRTEALPNDNSGNGEFHFGILKKPTGGDPDVTKKGFQPSGIDERITYSGVFQEDSASGCISLGGVARRRNY
ncbi:hypothetical protein B9Z65_3781 [Elsinoe australis]|uniref:Glycoside hydrolase 131 catalytic N-terminal domain-containing protein n=1 Tax=Elsinoe australis TaxID=40998 RepID=A0A2P8AG78_9PEZI|nr:hypothetical protein B9Z65_3781 [Elsinoe australis]